MIATDTVKLTGTGSHKVVRSVKTDGEIRDSCILAIKDRYAETSIPDDEDGKKVPRYIILYTSV